MVFGQDVFDKSRGPYGLKYYFYLSDAVGKKMVATEQVKYVPEYLVHFDHLEKIALEYDLKLEMKKNFHEFVDDTLNHPIEGKRRSAKNLLERMVERNLQGVDQQSVDEQWEIVGLYCVFIFKKIGQNQRRG